VVRVVVLAEDPLVRAGLAALLAADASILALGASSPEDPISAAGDRAAIGREAWHGADVVLWDVGPHAVPDPTTLARLPPGIPVLVLVSHATDIRGLLGAGASGALRRETSPERLAAALAAVARGLVVLDADAASELSPAAGAGGAPPAESLTRREQEVLQLLSRGHTNKEIARLLGISDNTAKFHVNAILAKLGAESRTEAVVRAARLGLVVL
jgi:DNA-binding NarL/FixJ family response regulator